MVTTSPRLGAVIRERLREASLHSIIVRSASLIVVDTMAGVRRKLGRVGSEGGTTHQRLSIEQSADYISNVFKGYKRDGNIDRFRGVAAELGPGDSAGLALLLRNDGCDHVDLIDRFRPDRDESQQAAIYRELSARFALDRFKSGTGDWDDDHFDGVTWHLGTSAEDFFAKLATRGERRYDSIVSQSVLEHLTDPIGAIANMAATLRPGGVMLHRVDLRDHEMFSTDHHELEFLRFPPRLYGLMTRNRGLPNRVLAPAYRRGLARLQSTIGLEWAVFVTWLVQAGAVDPPTEWEHIPKAQRDKAITSVRQFSPHIQRSFRTLSEDELAIAGIFIVARATDGDGSVGKAG